ncbi:hypothetical protein Sp245p_11175 [Azospirillum baldaniorum]|uniref:Ligand-binding protein with streptavidin-like fold n=1 Tax=Azospirillum baldaniorum TaxID=1064539 RepID=A0A9P1NLX4_9PROT|nr:Atu4866 domain-containing protein [Azospirillum baldaniorum]AWJ90310.1 hypothetical protein Sp245p_11175 [Azospirillum baldaniorum]TWA60626.1 putative ligand-binding protein with streptavidin-like fold [Azospirillum baldaniorum]TWA66996.1 putative ligand-binding protein with streptavidin-like fold [Azospirillum brasilense]CCC97588.1 exported protein of unknown function [Azospirillum baldaniorum]
MKRAFARTATLTAALLASGAEALPDRKALAQTADRPGVAQADHPQADHPYAGLWVTEDGRVRHELLPNNRYVEARGSREKAYQGRYQVTGDHIDYWDDTGFTADGDFIDGVLHHGGMILHRRR